MMKQKLILSIGFLTLGVQGYPAVGQATSTKCSPIVDQAFSRVSTKRLNLYEVNRDYLLRPEFQKGCELSKIDISPKYFWDYLNPQWKEPKYFVSLSDDQYKQLLAKVDEIKSLGSLVIKGRGGVVTNATLWLVDRYDKAYVERRLRDSVVEQDQPNNVTSFSVYFIRSVQGKVSDKSLTGLPNTEKQARLKINGRWYWVDEAEYGRAVIGKQGVFRAAGPAG